MGAFLKLEKHITFSANGRSPPSTERLYIKNKNKSLFAVDQRFYPPKAPQGARYHVILAAS